MADTVSFPDVRFEAAVREELGKPEGVITRRDAEAVEWLDVGNKGIFSLSGIEHFTALKWFHCHHNQLRTLDMSGNAELEFLDCSFNRLKRLNVTNNAALESLDCIENDLTELDLSNNPALKYLYCRDNLLSLRDIRGCPVQGDDNTMATVTIHRGTRQIGGCVTEIATETSRVFIDFGGNLPEGGAPDMPIEGLTVKTGARGQGACLFFTHYHGDHVGRLAEVMPDVPVYMRDTAKAILLNYAERVRKAELPLYERILTLEAHESVTAGDITVTPLPCDHSAFGAYMFVIDAGGRRILHTGDFRFHGRTGKALLEHLTAKYANTIDYIVCEGTTLSRGDGGEPWTEAELERKAAELMKKKRYVFVLCSSTAIDRIGAFYRANPEGRMFVCDGYQLKQLMTANEDGAGFENVCKYSPYRDKRMEENGFCMLVRQGEFFRRVMEKYKDDCRVIYSMWTGYIDERAPNPGLIDLLKPYRGADNFHKLHTSGHAAPRDIKLLYDTVKPKRGLIPIHTDAPEAFAELVGGENVVLLDDGETMEL